MSYIYSALQLSKFFTDNGFNFHLFDKITGSFLNNLYQPKLRIPTVPKEIMYIRIPYIGHLTKNFQSSLCKSLSKFYPQINFRFIPINNYKINSLFRYKDQLPTTLRSSIVYKYTCPCCKAEYIGSSLRAFKTRVDEHLGQSSRTGLPLHTPPHSAAREHSEVCTSPLNSSHFQIIESLHIKFNHPKLNHLMSSVPLNIV